jgi:CheY-like chemotaxis protein
VPTLLSGASILIIEDNHDVADTFALLLEGRGATARVAYSGLAGLEALEDFRPNLIFVDLVMSEMDGYEVALRVRSLPNARNAKLVAVTALPPHVVEERVRAAGFDGLLLKPVSTEAVKDLLKPLSSP